MTFWSWSRTASSNASADATINWAEGQAPSSVNDSARAVMAAAAKFRDDISGAIATGGTSTAYTVTSYQVFDTLAHLNGQMIAFTPDATNTNAVAVDVTLNVDGLGAKPIRIQPSVALPSGTLVLGTPYVVTYNSSDAVFYLRGFTNPYAIPLAGGMPFFASTAPNSCFVFPYGQAISRTTYATLFTAISTTYGTGDGSTTFNVPDLRGRVPAGKDDMGGSAASRLTSTYLGTSAATLGAVGGSQSHTLTVAQSPTGIVTFTPANHNHLYNSPTATIDIALGTGTIRPNMGQFASTNNGSTTSTSSGDTLTDNAGGGAHNNIQPTIVVNYIMRII